MNSEDLKFDIIRTPFSSNGEKSEIPILSDDGSVSIENGFGTKYGKPLSSDGKYVTRKQMNSMLETATSNPFFYQCGGYNTFNEKFCEMIGGYPKGSILKYYNPANRTLCDVVSISDSPNSVDFRKVGIDNVNWAYLEGEMFPDYGSHNGKMVMLDFGGSYEHMRRYPLGDGYINFIENQGQEDLNWNKPFRKIIGTKNGLTIVLVTLPSDDYPFTDRGMITYWFYYKNRILDTGRKIFHCDNDGLWTAPSDGWIFFSGYINWAANAITVPSITQMPLANIVVGKDITPSSILEEIHESQSGHMAFFNVWSAYSNMRRRTLEEHEGELVVEQAKTTIIPVKKGYRMGLVMSAIANSGATCMQNFDNFDYGHQYAPEENMVTAEFSFIPNMHRY